MLAICVNFQKKNNSYNKILYQTITIIIVVLENEIFLGYVCCEFYSTISVLLYQKHLRKTVLEKASIPDVGIHLGPLHTCCMMPILVSSLHSDLGFSSPECSIGYATNTRLLTLQENGQNTRARPGSRPPGFSSLQWLWISSSGKPSA